MALQMDEWRHGEESEGEKEDSEQESEEEEETLDVYPEKNSMVLRKALHSHVGEKNGAPQRENIFLTKCRISGELCDMIIDSGSETNTVSSALVTKLGLKTMKHPAPYKLSWLDKSKTTGVRKQCLVEISIGPYQDSVLCDVVGMDACHVLLGRPWQSDKKSLHDGYSNTYTITHNKKKLTLHPLPPSRNTQTLQPSKETSLLSLKEFEACVDEEENGYLLISKEVLEGFHHQDPELAQPLEDYEDVFSNELPLGLPPKRGMEHQIDLIPGAPFPNKPPDRCKPGVLIFMDRLSWLKLLYFFIWVFDPGGYFDKSLCFSDFHYLDDELEQIRGRIFFEEGEDDVNRVRVV